MCRTHHLVLALLALFVGIVHSWDIAVSVGDRLEFYTNGNLTATAHFKSNNLTEIAFDEVHNTMLFIDKQGDNDAICGYNLVSMDTRCFIKRNGSNIQDFAFDPATQLLFFTDTKEGSINWISLKNQGSDDNVHGNLLIKINDRTVKNIAVDSCRGYIYWTNTDASAPSMQYMERARFDGTERELIYHYLPVYSFAIDPQTHTNYYIDGFESMRSSFYRKVDIREKNLEAEKAEFTYNNDDNKLYFSAPDELTVSNNYLYWMNSSNAHTTIWQKPKKSNWSDEPRDMIRFYNEMQISIAANYRIKDQLEGLKDCEALSSLIPTTTAAIAKSFPIEKNTQRDAATGKPDFESCIPACEMYCLQGSCSYSDEGLPKCRCNPGYYGERCEVSVCHGYCINGGECTLNEEDQPVCKCVGNYDGSRCETVKGTLNSASQFYSTERNLTEDDLLSGKSIAKVLVTVEIKTN